MSELERESERRGREILRLALQAHIDARGDGDIGEAIVLVGEQESVRLTHKRLHTRPARDPVRRGPRHARGIQRPWT